MSGSSPRKGSGKPRDADAQREEDVRVFIAALRELPTGANFLFGMVQAAETSDGLLFAHPGDCGRWIYIPASAIHHVRSSGRIGCGAHSHATAEIALKEPQTDLEKTFANIAGLHRARLDAIVSTTQFDTASTQPCPPGFKWLPDDHGVYSCKPYP